MGGLRGTVRRRGLTPGGARRRRDTLSTEFAPRRASAGIRFAGTRDRQIPTPMTFPDAAPAGLTASSSTATHAHACRFEEVWVRIIMPRPECRSQFRRSSVHPCRPGHARADSGGVHQYSSDAETDADHPLLRDVGARVPQLRSERIRAARRRAKRGRSDCGARQPTVPASARTTIYPSRYGGEVVSCTSDLAAVPYGCRMTTWALI
jgi:hypothetical protein